MGFNKALLDVGGRPMIRVLIDQVRPLTDQILISSDDYDSYRFLNFPVIPDQYTGCGPLAGFHSAMHWNICSLYIMLACDLPNLRPPLLSNLISLVKGFDAAIPRTKDGLAHPLCAIYRRTCLPPIEQALKRGTNRVVDPFMKDMLMVRWIGPEEGQYEDADLANINTPEDLQRLKIPSPYNPS
jgi:molybdenum cofactor guanylyltransferase